MKVVLVTLPIDEGGWWMEQEKGRRQAARPTLQSFLHLPQSSIRTPEQRRRFEALRQRNDYPHSLRKRRTSESFSTCGEISDDPCDLKIPGVHKVGLISPTFLAEILLSFQAGDPEG
jgi:hypothetical protein